MKKHLITSVLILLVSLSLMACGAATTTSAATTTPATTAATTAAPTVNPADLAELQAVIAGKYTKIDTKYVVDAENIGTVLFAAEGTADDGSPVVAMKVKSARKFNTAGFSSTGWDEAEPSAYTMVIVVNKSTKKVVGWKVLVDGTKAKEYFVVPEKKINSYMTVAINSENAFDTYTDGLVLELDVKSDKSSDGSTIIAGTSIVFTGTSVDGTLSGQLVRNCFRTAAYFFSNYAK